jgi:ribosomal-protein-alanine N-acetyltransferase
MIHAAIHPLTLQDLDPVVSIAASSSLAPWSKRMFLEEMSNPHAHCFVMKLEHPSERSVIGFICFRTLGEESEVLNLCIHDEFRRTGLGRRLMQFYLQVCKNLNARRSYLEVSITNQPALHLYRSLAYRPVGRRPRFYQGKFDALLMTKEIG